MAETKHVDSGMASRKEDIGDVVGKLLPPVMRDRTQMRAFELGLDTFMAKFTPEQRLEMKEEVRNQLRTGMGALESIISRAMQSMG